MPRLSAITSVKIMPATASDTVIGSRSAISSDTGTRNEWLMPKSPCRAFQIHET